MLFRLQSIDKDGQRSYSPIRRVRFAEQTASLQVYPNPTTGLVTVSYKALKSVSVVDITGRELMLKNVANTDNFGLDLSALPKGIYLIKVTGINNKQQVEKLILK